MKRSVINMMAAVCSGTLVLTGVPFSVYGQTEESGAVEETASAEDSGEGVSKDETVYVLAGADGSVEKVIVSDWLKNTAGAQTLEDKTELTDIENVKGEEGWTSGSDDSLVWDAQGRDIYYQGNTEKELPVEISITYKLDGEEISPSELAGKSGKVTVRFDYVNRQYEEVDLDGAKETMYVPFAVVTGAVLDNDVFTNVEVSNGKLFDDGSHTVVAGIAFPGLQENLGISQEELEIPSYVEITGDAENFELGTTVTLAGNGLFNGTDMEEFDSLDDLTDSMGQLTDAMGQLLDGSAQLSDGLSALLEQSGELTDGVDQLAEGAKALKDGTGNVDEGADQLKDGAAQLSDGLNALLSNNDTLNGGAAQIVGSIFASADAQLAAAGLELPALTMENYGEVLDGVITQLEAAGQDTGSLSALRESLDSCSAFCQGLQSYTEGVAQTAAGAEALKTGSESLKEGTEQLSTGAEVLDIGILAVQAGLPELLDGITQLRDGAVQLDDGLKELNEDGIQKLADAVNGDLDGLLTRVRAMKNVSENYKSFAGASEEMESQVRFIFRTDSVSSDTEVSEEEK